MFCVSITDVFADGRRTLLRSLKENGEAKVTQPIFEALCRAPLQTDPGTPHFQANWRLAIGSRLRINGDRLMGDPMRKLGASDLRPLLALG